MLLALKLRSRKMNRFTKMFNWITLTIIDLANAFTPPVIVMSCNAKLVAGSFPYAIFEIAVDDEDTNSISFERENVDK
jgi:hypothetical protein